MSLGPTQSSRNQDITYWGPVSENKFNEGVYAAPILIRGRWEERSELVRTPDGQDITSQAVVFVASDVEIDGYLAAGDYTAVNDPLIAGAIQIRAYVIIPNLRNNANERRAYL